MNNFNIFHKMIIHIKNKLKKNKNSLNIIILIYFIN